MKSDRRAETYVIRRWGEHPSSAGPAAEFPSAGAAESPPPRRRRPHRRSRLTPPSCQVYIGVWTRTQSKAPEVSTCDVGENTPSLIKGPAGHYIWNVLVGEVGYLARGATLPI